MINLTLYKWMLIFSRDWCRHWSAPPPIYNKVVHPNYQNNYDPINKINTKAPAGMVVFKTSSLELKFSEATSTCRGPDITGLRTLGIFTSQ